MDSLLLLGATGLVGRAVLDRALADASISQVVAPTRRALPAHPRLINPVIRFDAEERELPGLQFDAVICALGTTTRDAGTRDAFRRVDYDYPLHFAQVARERGARVFALVSAMGADPRSRVFYSRTKGELEVAIRALNFESLTLVRPGLLGGDRPRRRPMEHAAQRVLGTIDAFLPAQWRIVPADAVAMTLLDAVRRAEPGVHAVESARILSEHRRVR